MRFNKKRLVVALLIVGATVLLLGVFFYTRDRSKDTGNQVETDSFGSVAEASEQAIAGGVTKKNIDEALFVARNYVEDNKLSEANEILNRLNNKDLNNDQLVNKYDTTLEGYRRADDKAGFTKVVAEYKKELLAREDTKLKQIAESFTKTYVDRIFSYKMPDLPEGEGR